MAFAVAKLEAVGIDGICERITDGETITQIAEDIGVSKGSLIAWLGTPDRSARANEARAFAASIWDEKAETGLEEAEDVFGLSKAKELAHHYRWRAAKMAPRRYGEKTELAHTGPDGAPLFLSTLAPISEHLKKS